MHSSSYSGDHDALGIDRAGRPLRVAQHPVSTERLLQRVVVQQPARQVVAHTQDQLDRLDRLDRADDARQHAQHARLGARRRQLGRRRLGQEAAVARAVVRLERGDLALELALRLTGSSIALSAGRSRRMSC
jgi:hypothetical protein